MGFAVDLGLRSHEVGDVGNGDIQDKAAGVLGVNVGNRVDGVVVVAGIDRVDGDERQGAQIGAAGKSRRFKGFAFGDDAFGEVVGDAVGVDRDQADLALVVGVAKRF